MPKPYPKEFREDVVRVARNREPGVTLEQIAADFGVHPITLSKWLRRDTDEGGTKPATASGESAELREARKRIRLLEQENEVLRRAAATSFQAASQQARSGVTYPCSSPFCEVVAGFVVVSGLCRHRDSIAPVAANRERFCATQGASGQRLP
ncbi:transposase [Streptomyces sp. NBC_00378]|uniref:transposase n=1 Tax=unclassified Streptomyces TaxID=2593676 RepID=UPI00225958C1|nr:MULTISPECIES: transposase [unclassified Streptomyces]MCX5112388.1 transposase [Streptomyces sp. NBC_00378]